MTISAESNIKNYKQLQLAIVDTLKTPPQSPLQAALWMTKHVNFGTTLGSALGSLIPGVGSIIGSLTDIFSAFSSAPSLGEIVIDRLSELSSQMANLKSELTATIERTAEIQTQRTTDFVLQGVDEIQKEVSALQIMQSISDESALRALAIEKNAIQTAYLAEYETLQKTAYSEIESIINQNQADLKKLYNSIMLRFGSMGLEFYDFLKLETAKPTQATQSRAIAPGATQQVDSGEPTTGFNWLYLSPLALLLFMDKKK